jgi:hypothetical protein
MSQTSITRYFSKRKRAGDEIKNRKKVLVLDHDSEADVSVRKEGHVIHQVLESNMSEALHSVCKKILVEDVSKHSANKLTHENTKVVPCENQSKASEKHAAQKDFQGRSKKTASQPSKAVTQRDIRQILLKSNEAEARPTDCTTLKTLYASADDEAFLVRLYPTEVEGSGRRYICLLFGIICSVPGKWMQNPRKRVYFEFRFSFPFLWKESFPLS